MTQCIIITVCGVSKYSLVQLSLLYNYCMVKNRPPKELAMVKYIMVMVKYYEY